MGEGKYGLKASGLDYQCGAREEVCVNLGDIIQLVVKSTFFLLTADHNSHPRARCRTLTHPHLSLRKVWDVILGIFLRLFSKDLLKHFAIFTSTLESV